jgi:2-oxoglutarate-Fe(II)-dependent dioxygenase family protein
MAHSIFVHDVNVEPARQYSLHGAVSSPIRVFHLADLGIDSADFLRRVGPTFHDLPLDPYDPALTAEGLVRSSCPDVYHAHEADWLLYWNELAGLQYTNPLAGPQFWSPYVTSDALRIKLSSTHPHRRRSCFQFLARPNSFTDYRWELQEIGTPTFAQAVSDVRARPRRFAPTSMSVYRDNDILAFIGITCQLVRQTASVFATTMRVTLHQMLTYADSPLGSEPAPEGTHQDGSPFIVSALVIERQNVTGGVSKVYYNEHKGLALERELPPGYGILQSDTHNHYWHQVTAIYPVDATAPAYRSILGLDIEFVAAGRPL